MKGCCSPLSSHAVTGSQPTSASFESQPDERAAGSSRASRPEPEDAMSRSSTPARASIRQIWRGPTAVPDRHIGARGFARGRRTLWGTRRARHRRICGGSPRSPLGDIGCSRVGYRPALKTPDRRHGRECHRPALRPPNLPQAVGGCLLSVVWTERIGKCSDWSGLSLVGRSVLWVADSGDRAW